MAPRFNNLKLYWKLLAKSKKSNDRCPINEKEFYKIIFLRINAPEDDLFSADPDITERVQNIIIDDIPIVYDELNVPISLNEVSESMKQLKNSKAGAEDLLMNEFFIHGSDILTPHRASLF